MRSVTRRYPSGLEVTYMVGDVFFNYVNHKNKYAEILQVDLDMVRLRLFDASSMHSNYTTVLSWEDFNNEYPMRLNMPLRHTPHSVNQSSKRYEAKRDLTQPPIFKMPKPKPNCECGAHAEGVKDFARGHYSFCKVYKAHD